MLLERIYDSDLAQASYFIGCQGTGKAIVIDPRRDIRVYQDLAEAQAMTIEAVAETHIHADYLSGTRELAAATGATSYLSDEGGEGWQYGFPGHRLHDQDVIDIGDLRLQALHTPGHTPEHMSFLLTDSAFADEPGYLFTGDFVFAGDLGRPDLLDEVAGGKNTRIQGAWDIFCSLRDVFLALPDHVQIYPAHGAGSACGKALGSVPSSTVGYERRHAWWGKFLAADDERGFIEELLDGQPDAHAYFARMKTENRDGPAVLGEREVVPLLPAEVVETGLDDGRFVLVDTRAPQHVREGTVPGALHIPLSPSPAVHAAWSFDPAADSRELVIFAEDQKQAQQFWDHAVRVGVDRVAGYVQDLERLPSYRPETVAPEELAEADYELLLDVRNKSEYLRGTIPGAVQLSAGKVLWNQDSLPRDGRIISFCQSGLRSSVAASALRSAGFDVVELEGSYAGWAQNMTDQAMADQQDPAL